MTLPHELRTVASEMRHPFSALMIEVAETLERRDAVIRLLEQDAHEARQELAAARGTRKVLWSLLGECLPLLEYDAQETHCGPSHEGIVALMQRIHAARSAVQAEELPHREAA